MKTLTLIRHAKSSWAEAGVGDHQRTLNNRGSRDAPEMGRRLVAQIKPDTILCSDAKRAQQTAQLLVPAMGFPLSAIVSEPRIYEASTSTLLAAIADMPDTVGNLLLIGHNPGLEQLSDTLLPGSVARMVTCAVSCYEIETGSWSELVGKPTRLLFHDYPKNDQRSEG